MLPEGTSAADEGYSIQLGDLLVRKSPAKSFGILARLFRVSGASQWNCTLADGPIECN